MKLTETELQELARQLRCPDGENGIQIGEMMNFTNSNIISKAMQSLDLQDGDTVLEIGPGNGSHVKGLFEIAKIIYHGIDISESMVGEAKNINSEVKNAAFHLSNEEHIPFSESPFDKIVTTNTIYFWKYPQAYVNEITRVLKSGGILSIGFISKSTMQYIPFAKFGFTQYDIETVTRLLETAGLAILEAKTNTEFITSNSGEQIEREFVILTAEKL